VQNAVIKAINIAFGNRSTLIKILQQNIETALNQVDETSVIDIDAKLESIQKELLKRANEKKDYNDIADEIYRLRELKQSTLAQKAERQCKRQRIGEVTEFLNEQSGELQEYEEQLVRKLIEKITVFNDKLTIELKSGIEINIDV
jgi:hypothetical protein